MALDIRRKASEQLLLLHVVERSFSLSVHHDRPELGGGSAFSFSSVDDRESSLFDCLSVFRPQVFNKLGPLGVGLIPAHEIIDDGVSVRGYFLVDVGKLEFGTCDFKSVECRIHASDPSINILMVEWGKAWLSRLLLSCSGCGDSSFDDGSVVDR